MGFINVMNTILKGLKWNKITPKRVLPPCGYIFTRLTTFSMALRHNWGCMPVTCRIISSLNPWLVDIHVFSQITPRKENQPSKIHVQWICRAKEPTFILSLYPSRLQMLWQILNATQKKTCPLDAFHIHGRPLKFHHPLALV